MTLCAAQNHDESARKEFREGWRIRQFIHRTSLLGYSN